MASNEQVGALSRGSTGRQIVMRMSPCMQVEALGSEFERFDSNSCRILGRIVESIHFIDARRTRS